MPKHLPEAEWPADDRELFATIYRPGDIFDDDPSGAANWSAGTRRFVHTAWRRWLGFLALTEPEALALPAPDRITTERMRRFVEHLQGEVRPASVALTVGHLLAATRAMNPDRDWRWLQGLKARLEARATPLDRFDRLIPPWITLDYAYALMDEAAAMPPDPHHRRETRYRDGLILAILSLWPIRRRSLVALTIGRHVILDGDQAEIRLFPEDTKAKRAESCAVPDQLVPYLRRYLVAMRPPIFGSGRHDALWASSKGRPLGYSAIALTITRLVKKRFGVSMSMHDFRRAAATYVAIEAPGQIGIIPGALQHTDADTSDRHYNLARGVHASRSYGATLSDLRRRLPAPATKK